MIRSATLYCQTCCDFSALQLLANQIGWHKGGPRWWKLVANLGRPSYTNRSAQRIGSRVGLPFFEIAVLGGRSETICGFSIVGTLQSNIIHDPIYPHGVLS